MEQTYLFRQTLCGALLTEQSVLTVHNTTEGVQIVSGEKTYHRKPMTDSLSVNEVRTEITSANNREASKVSI